MTQGPRKKDGRTKIDREFRRVAEEILRRDRELLERLAKTYSPHVLASSLSKPVRAN